MKKSTIILVAVVGLALAIGLAIVGYYNSFVRGNENVATAWAQVENQYQRRYELIPNLVETVKGITKQEKDVFTSVTEARSRVGQVVLTPEALKDPQAMANFQSAQDNLGGALSRLLAVAENYPQLKSNENFLNLQNQLEGTENRIAVERKRFNETVRSYNLKAKGIPGRWFVSMFGFDPSKALFEAAEGSEVAPTVDFSN